MKLTIISNFENLDRHDHPDIEVELIKYPTSVSLSKRVLTAMRLSRQADYILLNGRTHDLFAMALLRILLPFQHCKLVSVDLMLSSPRSISARLLHWIKVLALKRVDFFILYFQNTSGYEETFGISKHRIRFVPFKVNSFEYIQQAKTSDHGYIFTGGFSRRDYDTFLKAVGQLPFPVKMITGSREQLVQNGSLYKGSLVPSNVEVIPGCAPEEFISIMADARLVVIPLKEGPLAPAGLSVCLQAMALHKCVIVSAVPSIASTFPNDTAVLVPPGEPEALEKSIAQICLDCRLRESIADKGYRYSMALGGERRLLTSVLDLLHP